VNDELAQDPALVRDFLVESGELLEHMDRDMVSLESAPQDAELLNRIFRALHTIKGTSSFLGFDPVVRVSHSAEDVLNVIRRGEKLLDRRAIDALLRARDQLGIMLRDIGEGGLKQYALDALLAELEAAQKSAPASSTEPAKEVAKDAAGSDAPEKDVPRILLAEAAAETRKPDESKSREAIVEKNSATPQHSETVPKQKETDSTSSSQTMRVEAHKLDELINLIGELVLERNRLVQLSRDCSSGKLAAVDLSSHLGQSSARLSFITDELQAAGLKTRMLPIETVFRRFPRLVRDVARSLHKDVQLVIRGEDTELDKTMVELIGDPLVHLVRNSLDHGIEMPDVREQSGKPRQGTIRLEARQEGDQIVIGISDDGAGMKPERIASKAIEKGLVSIERVRLLSPREILDFIFLPGFSTAEKTSDLSGRGVGMDVVRSNLKKLNGSVEIDSHAGKGTTVLLRLPLTLAILPVLLVRVAEEIYALPLRSVVETAQVNLQHVHRVEDSEVLCLRDETLPLIRLGELFQSDALFAADTSNAARECARKVVILGVAEKRVALLVDHLIGQESTVIKPLGNFLHGCSSLAGATISGDGRVRLVLDPAGLLAASQSMTPSFRKALA
jgi:two-component system, chemotaxis family, sensor kinase CheA